MGDYIVDSHAGPMRFTIAGKYPTDDELLDQILPEVQKRTELFQRSQGQKTAGTVQEALQLAPPKPPPMETTPGGIQVPNFGAEPAMLPKVLPFNEVPEHARAVILAKDRIIRDERTRQTTDLIRNRIDTLANVGAGLGAVSTLFAGPEASPAAPFVAQGMKGVLKGLATRMVPTIAGAAGQAAADTAFDTTLEAGIKHGLIPAAARDNTPTAERIKSDAYMNLALGFGMEALAGTVGGAWQMVRATPEAQALRGRVASAASVGLNRIGIQDVTENDSLKAYSSVFGPYPYFGTPLRKAREGQKADLVASAHRFLFEPLAPVASLSRFGSLLNSAVGARFNFLRDHAVSYYDEARKLGVQAGPIFKLDNTNRIGGQILDELGANSVVSPVVRRAEGTTITRNATESVSSGERSSLTQGRTIAGQQNGTITTPDGTFPIPPSVVDRETARASEVADSTTRTAENTTQRTTERTTFQLGQVPHFDVDDGVDTFIDRIAHAQGPLTTDQMMNLSKDINDAFRSASSDQKRQLMKLKVAFEKDLEGASDPAIGKLILQGNQEYGRVMRMYSGPIASQFERVNKNVFTGSKYAAPGDLYSDQLGETILAGKHGQSVEALANLKELLGDTPYGKALFERSVDTGLSKLLWDNPDKLVKNTPEGLVFDIDGLRATLGLTTPINDRRSLLEGAFALSGKSGQLGKIEDFLKIAEENMGTDIPTLTTMSRRRQSFGLGAAAGGIMGIYAMEKMLPGQGGLLGLGGAFAVATGVRTFGKYLADPKRLQALTLIVDGRSKPSVARYAAQQFIRYAAEDYAIMRNKGRKPTEAEINEAVYDLQRFDQNPPSGPASGRLFDNLTRGQVTR